ncbi:MAG: hypothetical protein Q7T73_09435 [Beijerinckiaceae bacterium]|nr:hypothetical protein [Beijerinckiaceae bacterium]
MTSQAELEAPSASTTVVNEDSRTAKDLNRWVAVAMAATVATAVMLIWGRGAATFDAMSSLAWGREIGGGGLPNYAIGPTPHPLSNLVAAILSGFDRPDVALLLLSYLSLGAAVVAIYDIATQLAGRVAGVVAGALLVSRSAVLNTTSSALLDIPYTALVLVAVAIGLRLGRPDRRVFLLLGVAGLLRPEAWFIAGFCWLWHVRGATRRQAAVAAAAVALAPMLWVLSDLAATGNPLFSFANTASAASGVTQLNHGLGAALVDIPKAVISTAGSANFLAAALGFVVLGVCDRRRAVLLLCAAAAVGIAVAVPVAAGTLASPRYVLVMTGLVCVYAGVAAATVVRTGLPRSLRWSVTATAGLLLAVTVPAQAEMLQQQRVTRNEIRDSIAAARSLATGPVPCGPLVIPGYRLRPYVSVWRGLDLDDVVIGTEGKDQPGTYLVGTPKASTNVTIAPGRENTVLTTPPRNAVLEGNVGGWQLYANCGS